MANIGQTLFRCTGALLLAAGATVIDNPRLMTDAPSVAEAPVAVATVNIPEGARIAPGAVAVVRWPAHLIPPGAYSSAESVVGRVASMAVFRGEPLMPGRLAEGRQIRITPGKRAYSIRISDFSGIAGIITPESRVDILVTPNRVEGGRRMAKIFMTNIRVLAIGTIEERRGDGQLASRAVATIEVWPEEAEKLAIAATQGILSLALRGYGGADSVTMSATVAVPAVEYFPNNRTRARRPGER